MYGKCICLGVVNMGSSVHRAKDLGEFACPQNIKIILIQRLIKERNR